MLRQGEARQTRTHGHLALRLATTSRKSEESADPGRRKGERARE